MDEAKLQNTLKAFGELESEKAAAGLIDSETRRHTDNLDLFGDMIREAYDSVTMVVAGHHIMFTREGQVLPNEVPSADALIFNHYIAERIWDDWKEKLTEFALEPTETRDALVRSRYYSRQP